jgi:methyl-galactoside transport system ATP-binding protein/inositol transport system ATP-binding protein
MNEYVLQMTGVHKSFPGVKALKNVELNVRPASVHAVMGENGAGKSTLMKCLIGMYTMDSGKILFKGKDIVFRNMYEALSNGISMIHQELSPVPERSVKENVWLGREPRRGLMINHKKLYSDTVELFKYLNMDIDPNEKMGSLSIAKMQMVEIAKAVSYDSAVVVMDEPTSTLTQSETEHLFRIIEQLKEKGVSVIYISHKMDEILRICDEISVYRDGEYVGTDYRENMTIDRIISMMVGREITEMFPKIECPIGKTILKVENLSDGKRFRDISFELRRGEILGFAGLVGAGRTEIVETIFGIRRLARGKIYKDDKEITIKSAEDAVKHKIALLTEDRRFSGTVGVLSILENTVLANLKKYGFPLRNKKMKTDTQEYINRLKVRTPNMHTRIMNLSGGNQQKVLVSRWLLTEPDILFVDEPTRGIDVGAKAEIHTILTKLAGEGKAIIMISSEMPEILGMSDRVLVMCEGKMTGIIDRQEATQELIMQYATGEFSNEENVR